jgi:4-hydroxy-4-methyl-2-oxoglutarate aldolase
VVDHALIEMARTKLYSAVLSDTLDSFGYLEQALPPSIRPLDDRLVLCGRARTGLYMAVHHDDPAVNIYAEEIALVDDLKPGEVALLACAGNLRIAPWGELLSTAARARGAVGCVTDGLVRDVRVIREMGFAVFSGGIGPLDTRHRGMMMQSDVPVRIGGVRIESGDLIFGDVDGVVVVPQSIAGQVVAKALDKVTGENMTRDELARGALLKDVYEKYGVL